MCPFSTCSAYGHVFISRWAASCVQMSYLIGIRGGASSSGELEEVARPQAHPHMPPSYHITHKHTHTQGYPHVPPPHHNVGRPERHSKQQQGITSYFSILLKESAVAYTSGFLGTRGWGWRGVGCNLLQYMPSTMKIMTKTFSRSSQSHWKCLTE